MKLTVSAPDLELEDEVPVDCDEGLGHRGTTDGREVLVLLSFSRLVDVGERLLAEG